MAVMNTLDLTKTVRLASVGEASRQYVEADGVFHARRTYAFVVDLGWLAIAYYLLAEKVINLFEMMVTYSLPVSLITENPREPTQDSRCPKDKTLIALHRKVAPALIADHRGFLASLHQKVIQTRQATCRWGRSADRNVI